MRSFNIEVTMTIQNPFSADASLTPAVVPEGLECGSPLPLPVDPGPIQSGSGLPHSKTLARWRGVLVIPTLLLLGWLALPGRALAQVDWYDELSVAAYVKGMLYWTNADPTARGSAAFRYKDLLYTNDASGIRPDRSRMSTYYGNPERDLAQSAESELLTGLSYNSTSALLRGLLLDIYYDRTAAELILAANSLATVDKVRQGPPSVPTGLVIDDEIGLYRQALEAYRSALMTHFSFLNNGFGQYDIPPAGYQWFRELVPSRALTPATYLSEGVSSTNSVPVPVGGSSDALFNGYKDLVLLLNGLRDYGRAVVPLARLQATRNNAGDVQQAMRLVSDSQRFLFLQYSTLLGVFQGLNLQDTNVVPAASGLAAAAAGVSQSLLDLETLGQTIRTGGNLLGFESDFLMLAQKYVGQSGTTFDSFDALQLRLQPSDLSSPLRYAKDLQAEAWSSYNAYQGFQEQLELQVANLSASAEDRLFQIVGARPGTPEYARPESNTGSESWQQVQSIQVAQLHIRKNQQEMTNLLKEVQYELERSVGVSNVTIKYANKQAKLTEMIGHISAAQAAAQAAADAANSSSWWGAGANALNAAAQAAAEEAKGRYQAEKERQAGLEQAEIGGIESAARVKTLLLGMDTLAVDSAECALLLAQEMGRLTALGREKADLEGTLAENQRDLAGRYFADPVHHLRYLHQTMLANLSFEEAQKWLYFMVRSLEYKWNTPFMNYFYLGRRWSTGTLFKLRNANELEQFYNAMVSFNSLVQLPSDDYWDWFSVREDFFGYKKFDGTGTNLAYYPDPANPNGPATLTCTNAFRQRLMGLTNALGTITLNFSTVREIAGGTFFRGPRFDSDANRTVLSAGLFLDKVKWIKINLPGSHSLRRSLLAGELTYGGSSFVRNFDVGTFVPGRPDRLTDEMTAYGTRYWFFHAPSAAWRFSEALKSPVTMTLTNDSRVPPTVGEIEIFKERSVATTGWVLTIPTQDLGTPVMKIDELDDVELFFYHYAVSRETASGKAAATGQKDQRDLPFPYYLKYHPNPEGGGK
jgi:hypothetical protein